jgi:hypothetical protein
MKNTWIGFLIVLSIAVQSFVAVANSESNHQLDSQHLQTEQSPEIDYSELKQETSESEHNVKDCHHCGHCQGSHTQWFSSKNTSYIAENVITSNQYHYLTHVDKNVIEQLIRPPIV